MKQKHIITLLIVFLTALSSHACDICGCGLGNYYIGMVPQFNKGFFGLRYQYRYFHTQLISDKSQYSDDYFHTVELWGGLNLGKHFQVLAFVPYSFNYQNSDDGVKRSNGMGDVAALLNYSLLEKTSLTHSQKLVYQQLMVGGGIKLPTGSSNIDPTDPDIVALANSQLGSGSTDFMLNAAYTIRVDKLGFSTNLNYKINTPNKERYQFGNRITSNSFIFYSIKARRLSLTPNLGALYEQAAANKLQGSEVDQTGGHALLGVAGLELSVKNVNFGVNAQLPLAQDYAMGQTKTRVRAMAHITFGF